MDKPFEGIFPSEGLFCFSSNNGCSLVALERYKCPITAKFK